MTSKKEKIEPQKNAEDFEIVDRLDYKKHPELCTKIFQDPLKEIPDEDFAPKKKKRKPVFKYQPAGNDQYFRGKTA
jgi:hypothetical protein